jgi:2-phosphoglycolate phosphatase
MAILFDLDGTLLDTSHDLHNAINQVLQLENKPPVSYEKIRNRISFGSRHMLAAALDLDLYGNVDHIAYADKLLPIFLDYYAKTQFKHTVAFSGINDLLSSLEAMNITWGIVTNKSKALTEPLLKYIGYSERSACIVCGDTAAKAKPAPDPLFYACNLLKVNPTECVYVGDAITDIQAGKAAGMRTMAAAFGFIPDNVVVTDWQADVIVNNPDEIFPWIQKWSKRIL